MWLAGQIIYVVLTTIIYNVLLVVWLGIIASPFSFIGNVWSKTAAMLGYGGGENITVPVSIKTMEMSTPYSCALAVFVLMLCYSLLVAVLMLFFNIALGNMTGVLSAFALNLYGILLNPGAFQKIFHFSGNLEYRANVLCGWLSPLNHATFPMHNFGYDYLPTLRSSVGIFLLLIILLISLSGLSGFENLKRLAALKRLISNDDIRAAMQRVGLDPMSKKKVGQYSLGMRERLGIAQAIMEDPDLLILDEPFNGLDKKGAKEVYELLKELKKREKTILIAAHNMQEIEWLCDSICEMDAGVLTLVK